jgi:hypothetical protein
MSNIAEEQEVEVDAVELKTIEIRLNGVKESTQRSRFIFIVMTIVACAILITLWNSTLSWDTGYASLSKVPSAEENLLKQRIGSNRDLVITEWVKNLVISVGLLGIRVSGTDLAVIGSASLIVVMTWYFYSQRRENRAIVSLLRDCVKGYETKQLNEDVCYMVFQGIVHSIVFIDLGRGDGPLSGVEDEPESEKHTFLVRKVVKALVYIPPVTILLIIASDIWSLSMPSPIREVTGPLWNSLNLIDRATVFAFELIALLSVIYTAYLCYLSSEFSKATADTLKEYEEFIKEPETFLEAKRQRGKVIVELASE